MKYLIAACALFLVATAAQADRPDHFRGLPADTLQEAVQNFSEYNQRLAAILDNRNLGRAQMAEVHQLTYTLEPVVTRCGAIKPSSESGQRREMTPDSLRSVSQYHATA